MIAIEPSALVDGKGSYRGEKLTATGCATLPGSVRRGQ